MLLSPHGSLPQRYFSSQSDTSTNGTTVTASSTIHTKGAWSEVVASTPFDAVGIWVQIGGTATGSTATAALLDVGIGAASSEEVLIPDLMAGSAAPWNGANAFGHGYFFPITIPAGSRLSARMQALISSDTAEVIIILLGGPKIPGMWTGSRVTAYGVDSANSSGVAVLPGTNNTYGSAAQIVASCANPLRAVQIGIGSGADSTDSNLRRMLRLGVGATPTWIIENLIWASSTTIESLNFMPINWTLSQMAFNIPAASELQLAAMNFGAGTEDRFFVIYGVD